jgi:UDP-N-acetylmuramoyl-tripeptide--D-alanyl-D-alanine ligase
MALPLSIEAALWLARPIEGALLGAFVKSAEKKLHQLAPDVVAITGSYGKTSVKEHVRDLVGRQRRLTASPASFNNQAGLARTVNEYLTPGTEVLLCEMGTYGRGEIAAMCEWVKPRVAAITRIGPVHLERMKTLEGIRDAKAEILIGAEVAVLNIDDSLLAGLAGDIEAPQRLIRCSTDAESGADVIVATAPDGQVTVRVDGEVVTTTGPLPTGVHASNVAVALGCAVALGADPAALASNISALLPPSHRLDPATNDRGLVVLDDTFNSNPDGAQAALDALVAAPGDGRRVVVTPGMVELGPIQVEENTRFARSVAEAGAELVVVGRVNRRALVAGYDAGRPPVIVAERADAVAWVRSELGAGDAVLYENDLPDHYP